MSDPNHSTEPGFWAGLRSLLTGRSAAATLREEIAEAIEEHAADTPSAGDLSPLERQMLSNLLDLSNRRVEDAAVPRSDIIAFNIDQPFQALVERFAEAGHSRLPVYKDNLDHVVGMIHVKDVYARLATGETAEPEALIRPVLFVPNSMRVLDLLARMRIERTHMAIVIDEFGGTDGLATIEDLVEEIVGDIEDEHDDAEEAMVAALEGGGWEADARIDLGELEPVVGENLDLLVEEQTDTLGGLIFALAGRVPEAGEWIEHPSGWRFEITASNGRRIERARVHAPERAMGAAA